MFRPVRRIKNALGEEATKEILRSARRGVIAVNGDGGYPYAIPINYLYDEEAGKIYFHGAKAGHKADSINKCNKVCFTACGDEIVRKRHGRRLCAAPLCSADAALLKAVLRR